MWIAKSQNEYGASFFESENDFSFSEIGFESFKKIRQAKRTCRAAQAELCSKTKNITAES